MSTHGSFQVARQVSAGSPSVWRLNTGQPGSPDALVGPVQVPVGPVGEQPVEIDRLSAFGVFGCALPDAARDTSTGPGLGYLAAPSW